jgi:hypothetical protein
MYLKKHSLPTYSISKDVFGTSKTDSCSKLAQVGSRIYKCLHVWCPMKDVRCRSLALVAHVATKGSDPKRKWKK